MKKAFLSILTILYMTMSSGIAMEIHYCMGKKAGVDFYHAADENCSRCGMKEQKTGCCSDEHKFYKLADAHKQAFNNLDLFQAPALVITEQVYFSERSFSLVPLPQIPKAAPPGDPPVPVYIRNCVFRI